MNKEKKKEEPKRSHKAPFPIFTFGYIDSHITQVATMFARALYTQERFQLSQFLCEEEWFQKICEENNIQKGEPAVFTAEIVPNPNGMIGLMARLEAFPMTVLEEIMKQNVSQQPEGDIAVEQ